MSDLVRELQELIAALDRRLPRVEQAGESAIAQDAAALREKAIHRLKELKESSRVGDLRSAIVTCDATTVDVPRAGTTRP